MVDAAPFHALRYDPAVAGEPALTSAPAYDELERFAYARHRTASPYTVLELIAASAPAEYEAAGAAYRRWRRTGVLVRDEQPGFFVYEEHELRSGVPAVQRGLLAAVLLDDTGEEILPHEDVQPERVADRVQRLAAVPVDLSPVYTFSTNLPDELSELLARRPRTRPIVAASDERGIDHRMWKLEAEDAASIPALLSDTTLVIADGHHRYAAALEFRDRCRRRRGHRPGGGEPPSERVLAYIVDATRDGTQIHAVHRLVRPFRPASLERLARDFTFIDAPADPLALRAKVAEMEGRAFGLRLPGGTARLLRAKRDEELLARMPRDRSPRWRDLDAAVLEHAVLPRLGASTVEYHADLARATAEVESGSRAALFVLRPVSVHTVAALAAAHETMPIKTTYFRPKPRAGLLLREVVDVA